MNIEILCTGDEVVSGKTINTNYSYMATLLHDHGFNVAWGTTVGDNEKDLQEALRLSAERADVVIVNGGLGPTVDDLSQQVVAQVMSVPLICYPQWLSHIKDWYASRGREMPETNNKQAMLPEGAEIIDNPVGTACGFKVRINDTPLFFTPGVPHELKRMFVDYIIPQLQMMRGSQYISLVKCFHTFGIGESRADALLANMQSIDATGAVKLGFQSHFPELEIKLTISGEQEIDLRNTLVPYEKFVRQALGDFILSEDDDTLVDGIQKKLRHEKLSMGLLETYTAGRISDQLMEANDSALKRTTVVADIQAVAELIPSEIVKENGFEENQATKWATTLRQQWNLPLLMMVLAELDSQTTDKEKVLNIMLVISSETECQTRKAKMRGSANWIKAGASHLALDCLRRFLSGQSIYQKIDFEQWD